MRILLFALISFFLFPSCSTPPLQEETVRTDSVPDTLKKIDTVIVEQKFEFDLHKFKRTADSLLAVIDHKADTFRIDTDTSIFSGPGRGNWFNPLIMQKGRCRRYFLNAPGKSSLYGFWLVTASFPDSSAASGAFDELHKRSRDEEPRDEFMPGLTYENDYLLLERTNIYWLNTGCVYGGPINSILRNSFRASTCERTYRDSILVYCGDRAKD